MPENRSCLKIKVQSHDRRDPNPAQYVPVVKPAAEVHPGSPTWKEPAVKDHRSSGEPEGSDSGGEID